MLSEKLPWPELPDAEPLADRAARPVGGDRYLARTVRSAPPSRGRTTAVTPSASCSTETARTRTRMRAPSSAASSRIGSSPIWVTKRRGDGLMSSTPSLMYRKYQSSSFPPRLSTETIAPFWTNSRSAASSIVGLEPDGPVRLDRALVDERRPRVDRRARAARERATARRDDRGRPLSTARRGCRPRSERERLRPPSGLPSSVHVETPDRAHSIC